MAKLPPAWAANNRRIAREKRAATVARKKEEARVKRWEANVAFHQKLNRRRNRIRRVRSIFGF